MVDKTVKTGLVTLMVLACHTAYAELPLVVEDLTTAKNRFKLVANFGYFNAENKDIVSTGVSTVDLGNGRSISIPRPSLQGVSNQDVLIASLGLKYGISKNTEIGIKTNGFYQKNRQQLLTQKNTNSKTQWQDIWLTGQYQMTKDHKTLPDSLVFSEVALYENKNTVYKSSIAKSVLLGVTTYTVNDPLVLSVTASYDYRGNRKNLQNHKVNVGDSFSLNGLIGFAVNPDITLNTGLGWKLQQADSINGEKQSINNTQTNMSLGFAYAVNERSNVTINVRSNISGNAGSTVTMGITTKLGELPKPLSERYRQIKNK